MKSNFFPKHIIIIIAALLSTTVCFSMYVASAQETEESEISIKSFAPRDKNGDVADFLITLSKTIADEKLLFTELPKDAIKTTPSLEIKARWMAHNQIGIFLEGTLAPSVDYTFEISTKLDPSDKLVLTGKREFIYSTAPFKVESSVIEFRYDKDLKKAKGYGNVTFNYPVSIAGLEEFLLILSGRGDEIPYVFQKQSPITKSVLIEFDDILPLLEGQFLQVKIGKGLKCIGTEIGLKAASAAPIQLANIKELRVNRADFLQRNGIHFIRFNFSSPITIEMFQDHISMEPSLPFKLAANHQQLEIYADFKFRSEYTVNIKRGVASADGSILRNTFVRRLNVPDLHPRIRFIDESFFMPRKGALELNLGTTNVEQIGFGIAKIYSDKLPMLIQQGELKIEPRLNEEVTTTLSLKDYLTDEHAGMFKVVVHSDRGRRGYTEQLVVITDLGIVAKRIDKELWVWVNSLDSLDPIQKAKVELINKRDKKALLTGETDDAGFAKLTLEEDMLKDNPQFLLTVTKDNDFSLLQLDRHQLSTHGFSIGGIAYLRDGHEAFVYTERGVYRPGETVNLIGIVRGKNNEVPASLPLRIDIMAPYNSKLREIQKQTDNDGVCEVQIPIPAYAPTGWYAAKMWSDEKQIGTAHFQVEEFVPDRMKVTVTADKDTYMLGDEVNIEVNAENLFGTPAVGRNVSANYYLSSTTFDPPEKWRTFNFYDATRTFSHQRVQLDTAVTDIDGKVEYQFTLPEDLKPPSALNANISTTVQELGGRAVSASKRLTVHPYSHYVGIKRTKTGTVKRNEETTFNYIVIDPEGNVDAGRTLKVTISAIERPHHWRTQRESTVTELESYTVQSEDEVADFSFTPVAYGVHRVEVEDVEGGAKVSTQFYVAEWGGVSWSKENPNTLDMTLDKATYRPGEKAKLEIKAPFSGKVLLTIEREKVLSFQTVMIEANSATLTIPVQDNYGPNVYLSAMLIRSTTSLGKDVPARAFGVVPLKLDAKQHELKVEMNTPEQIRPNQNVEIKFRVQGERKEQPYRIAIAAVDEGILQLTGYQTPKPHNRFYQQRRLNTVSYEFYNTITKDDQFPIKPIESLADLMNVEITVMEKASTRRQLMSEERLVESLEADSAGANLVFSRRERGLGLARQSTLSTVSAKLESRLNTDSVVRVSSVALWSGITTTNAEGNGSVRFKVPQFNGTLRVMAVAFSGADYGSATEKIQVRDPVVLTPTFPRFLTGGDRVRIPVSIYNSTGNTGTFTVKLKATGPVQLLTENGSINNLVFVKEDTLEKHTQIASGKEGQLYFDVVTHDEIGIAEFNLSASGNGEEIQFAPMRLPVRSAAPPVTKTGHGMVREGESADFIFPSNLRAETSEFMLTVSPLPTVRFANGLRYLVRYPHGCLEQTTSRVFPLLYLSDLARIVEPELADEGKIDEYINAGITKLEDMLLPDHHFAYWQGRSHINNWSSVYASHFLVEARKAGYKVSDNVYNRMLEGLRQQARRGGSINAPPEKSDRYLLARAAYACYVLAAANQPEKSVMHYLRNNRLTELNIYSQFQLAGAFALSGDVETALSMLPEEITLEDKEVRDSGRNFDSSIRAQAIILDVLVEIKEDHPAITKLVESLTEAAAKGQRWANTQENAFALLALGKFLNKRPNQKYTGTLTRNGAHFANFDSTSARHTGSDWDGEKIDITVKGEGTCYYYWEAFGISRDSYIEEYGRELQLTRRYLTPDGSRVKNNFKQGELVIAEITVEALTSNLENVAVVDMLPAGFEIENPRLVTREGASTANRQGYRPSYVDIRDDRLVFYGTFQLRRQERFYYALRAVTEGTFTVPPVSAEAMYDPTKSAVASMGTIQIVK